jgi:F-box-like
MSHTGISGPIVPKDKLFYERNILYSPKDSRIAPIDSISNEVFQNVVDCLPTSDLFSCVLVSRRWTVLTLPSLWRTMTIRIHPLNNHLMKELSINDTLFENFYYTSHLRLDLSIVGPIKNKPTLTVVDCCLQNLKLFRRISTFLTHRLTTLTIHLESFGWNPDEV